jgi:hypothetical protein
MAVHRKGNPSNRMMEVSAGRTCGGPGYSERGSSPMSSGFRRDSGRPELSRAECVAHLGGVGGDHHVHARLVSPAPIDRDEANSP